MMEGAKVHAPRCLTNDQRTAAFLDREPPAWCIEMEKWPYQTPDWKEWLKYRDANAAPPLADTAEWQHWVAVRGDGTTRTQHDVSANLSRLGIMKLQGGDQAAALAAYQKDLDTRATLEQKSVSDKLEMRGDAKLRSGDQAGALAAYQESLDILRKLRAHAEQPQCDVLIKIGDVKLHLDDQAGAIAAYQECGNIALGIGRAQREAWKGAVKIGDVKLRLGDQARAIAAYQESLDFARNLTAEDGPFKVLHREVAVSLTRIGDVKSHLGDYAGALAAYQESLDFLAEAGGEPFYAPDVWFSLTRLGDVKLQTGDLAGALAAYQESLDIARKVAARDQGGATDLWFSLFKLGEAKSQGDDRAATLAIYQESLDIARKLAGQDHGDALAQRHMWLSLTRVGALLEDQGSLHDAIADFDQAIVLDPNSAIVFYLRGTAYSKAGNHDRAIADFDQALVLDPKNANSFNARCRDRAIVGRDLSQALADCSEALRLRPDASEMLNNRGLVQLKLAAFDRAITDYDAAMNRNAKDAVSLYGRGLAKLKTGNTAGGNADIAAAKAIQADIAEVYAGYGVK